MNIDKKPRIKAELARRRERVSAGNYETGQLRIARLLGWLMRPNPLRDRNGDIREIISVRAYLLKYNRKEYRQTLNAIANNRRTYGVTPHGLNMTYSCVDYSMFKPAMSW